MARHPGDLLSGLRFALRLPSVLRRRVGHAEALACVRERLARRADDFLALLRDAVYAQAAHPLRRLLTHAGCTHGDVAALVRREGLEGALAALWRAGVYLTADELAGRRPVVRGSERFAMSAADLRNPWAVSHLVGRSGGSRSGTPTAIALDLDALLDQLPDYRLALVAAGGGSAWAEAIWAPPGSIGLAYHLRAMVAFGRPIERWFSPLAAAAPPSYDWALRVARLASRAAGARLPLPEPLGAADPAPVLAWIEAVRRRGCTPLLGIYPSAAAQLCDAGARAGVDLRGVRLSLRGEPLTAARLAAAERVGAEVLSLYGAIECGVIGHGCLRRAAADEVHLHGDLHAVIQPGQQPGGGPLPADALLLTTLRRSARLVLVNASLGDQAVVDERRCDCPLQAYGWSTHLRDIRSFEKLTGMGMTFADAEVAPLLEQVLPARFGGAPTDYQLSEEEAADGGFRLCLTVHPRLGRLDEAALVDAFLLALADLSPTRRVMALAWRAAGVMRVDRSPPAATAAGKILHFRRADAARDAATG
ncbi:MAG: hypothetical protein SF182_26595 [Deltaproteobacteria bacterium]|nr:hypothetical protein [Deltaproteobacteria bacterium]